MIGYCIITILMSAGIVIQRCIMNNSFATKRDYLSIFFGPLQIPVLLGMALAKYLKDEME